MELSFNARKAQRFAKTYKEKKEKSNTQRNTINTKLKKEYKPAFQIVNDSFQPTSEWQKVSTIMQRNTDTPINVQPAPSILTGLDGRGIWGTGGGIYRPRVGDAYVDPIFGSVTTAAHEAAHQAFGSRLINDPTAQKKSKESLMTNFTPEMIADGTAMRVGYEAKSKPIMLEEANAQGVAAAAMRKAGMKPSKSGWPNMLSYPGEYRFGGSFDKTAPMYQQGFNKPGLATFLPGEMDTFDTVQKSYLPAIERQYTQGYERIK